MNAIIDFANAIFKPLIDMGAPTIMLVVLTIIALCFRVKFSKALEGGMKLAIALTAIGDIMNLLTTSFAPAMINSLRILVCIKILWIWDGHHLLLLLGVLHIPCTSC